MIFSIILPTISSNDNFFKALEKLVNQNFKFKYEIIIINDNPNLKIKRKINSIYQKEINKRFIRIIQNKKNIGLTKSLNKSIKLSIGKFIIRNDEDDFSNYNRLNEIYKVLKSNKKIKFLTSNYKYSNGLNIFRKNIFFAKNIKNILKIKNPFAHSTVCFEKKLFFKLGCYNETLKVSQDYELWSRFINNDQNSFYYLNKSLVTISINKNSISKRFSKYQKINSILIALKNNHVESLLYNNYSNGDQMINTILGFKSKQFKTIQNTLYSLLFCYSYEKNKHKLFNFNILYKIIKFYLVYPTQLIKKIIN